MTDPRGIRNNNPGNILWTDRYMWQGQSRDIDIGNGLKYCVFESPEYGFRAMTLLLLHLEKYRMAGSINELVGLWSKGQPNADPTYARFVARQCGVDVDATVDLHSIALDILKGITHYENGEQPYSDTTILRGIQMAHVW